MEDVGVRFSGNSAGAVGAARETATAIDKVKLSAVGSSAPLRGMEKDLGRVERGALAGSGAFKGLGRSVAFASGAFLGAAGFAEVLKHSIDVTLAAQTSITHLDQAVKNAHASVKAMTPILEAHAAAARKLGFDDNDTRDAEAKLVTAFGATKQALDELRVAQDLARQSNIPLGDATRQLILMQEGNARAAKQFGLSLPDLTKKQWEAKAAADGLNLAQEKGKTLYDELLPRIKDQAKAYADSPAGKIAEFHAEVTHLEESIGTGLLPVVDKYLTEIDDWLAKGRNQRKVTADVRKVVDELAGVLHDAKNATQKFLDYANPVVKTLGGWQTAIETLIAFKFASVIVGWGDAMKTTADRTLLLNQRLGILSGLLAKPFQFIIAYEIIKKITGSNADLSNNAGGAGDLLPVFQNGKWVDPMTGVAVADQAYWNTYFKKTHGGSEKPKSGQTAGDTAGTSKQRALVHTAETLGPGSGGVYVTGGTGGTMLVGSNAVTGYDCSGYLYDIYKQNGMTIPRTSEAQWNDPNATPVPKGQEQPGDGVYFTGSSEYAPPGHCGIYVGGGKYISYYQSGKPAAVFDLANATDYWGARRWVKVKKAAGGGDTSPYGPALSSGDAGGSPATAKTKKPKWVGATAATIVSAQGSVSALLRGLPTDLDPVEKNAVAHIKAIQDSLHIHMSAADLAKDRVELTKWGKVLHDEINKQAAVVKAAAAAAKKVYDQALTLDISHVLRDFDEAFQGQMHTFDTETSRHLQALQDKLAGQLKVFDAETKKGLDALVVTQTPEEKALADFEAKRSADQAAKQKSDLEQQIADTKSQLDGLGAGASGTLIDIATGTRTPLAGQQLVDQRKQLQDQLLNLQDQYDQLQLDEQDATLKAAADASRKAADDKTQADQDAYQQSRDDKRAAIEQAASDDAQAYQDGRDAQKQALQDLNDDQRTALQNSLDDWVANLEAKKKTWADFLQWMKDHGYSTTGLIDPSFAASLADPAGAVSPTGDPRGSTRLGTAIGFAAGGKVPGRYVGRQDTIMARLTPGETVIDRQLTAALEEMVANGGGAGGSTVAVFNIDKQPFARAVAAPMTAEQARQIGYTMPRG